MKWQFTVDDVGVYSNLILDIINIPILTNHDDRVASVLLYLSRRRNRNSELSYKAELSCLSKSSISLASEKKKSAVFGSQRTATLD